MAGERDEKGEIPPNEATDGEIRTPLSLPSSYNGTDPFMYWTAYTQQPFPCTTSTEYIEALRVWLNQYHSWSQSQWFQMSLPYYMMGYMAGKQKGPLATPVSSSGPVPVSEAPNQGQNGQRRGGRTSQGQRQNRIVSREFRLAPVWKRVLAEFIDFLLLFVLKLAVTIVAVEYMGLIDLDQYDVELQKLFTKELDINIALGLTTELVALEVINRVFITIFEALCLRRGMAGTVGGTTPGKRALGIVVVSCEETVADVANGVVRITPAGDIGFWNALVRSVIKNFSLAFFFPVCFTALFFQHHRAAYDVISNCVVVEPLRPRRR